ncbi:uncharacterized protein LTHEOB_391 [Lasiodiplodia theobromae]|uniref:Uncharacterized protein n=1 Tax=Lasiodiplodia theobromae TaxID=45133 RepID=A0A5N5DJB9_9PEZI|nr:uncharacterized protein LTHEOB_391 [Lasiodiplodia theobromae]KAB2577032.1 hypothetical protein DBV05_g4301 [Lasiodiplodia theobromae]KAF4543692.1 hypothetical protein LTHEOB_391 [Lasiodiplodia theobromae]
MAEPSPKRRRTSAEPPVVSETGDFRPRNTLRRTPPRRPSFLSPTKASLARFNPEILSRRASTTSAVAEPDEPSRSPGRGQRALAYVLGESHQNPDDGNAAPAAQQHGEERRHSIGGRLLPSRDVLQAAAADQLAQESAAHAERRTDVEDDLPTFPKGSPAARPDLPPHAGLFSSPSKKARRNKSLGQRLSSPFKPRELPLRPEPADREAQAGAENPSPRGGKLVREEVQESPRAMNSAIAEQRLAPAMPKVGIDPMEKEKERLGKQLQEMQEEIKQYEREVERSRTVPGHESAEDISTLISLITKADSSLPASRPEVPPLSSLLSAFLPLAKPVHPPSEKPEKPLPSHEPIELDTPLPYLKLFTTFQYDSRVDVDNESGHQIHFTSIRSPGSLLHLDLELFVDPATRSVSKLNIKSLSPWASHELGTWIRSRAAENDVGAVCWATESYYDVAVKRAQCWARCYRKFARLLDPERKGKGGNKKNVQREGGQHDAPASSNLLEEETEEVSGIGSDLASGGQEETSMERWELLQRFGRDSITFQSKHVLFKVSWRIRFDWTGEAESVVGADAALPGVWHEADDRGSFRKISATFDQLALEMGVFEATKTMVGLLFNE